MSTPFTPSAAPGPARVRGSGCPLCGKPPLPAATPFCSAGCRDRDLIAWLGDGYRVPGPPLDEETLSGADGDASGNSGLGSSGLGNSGLDRDA